MFIAQILHNLKDCDIDLDATLADATPLRCFTQIGEDFDALGPLFTTNNLLNNERSKRQTAEIPSALISEPDKTLDA